MTTITFLQFGDSITVGNGCPPTGSARDGWRVGTWNKASNEGVNINFKGPFQNNFLNVPTGGRHYAVGGQRIEQLTASLLTHLNTYQPQAMSIHLATNDCEAGPAYVSGVFAAYDAVFTICRNYSTTMDILSIVPIPLLSSNSLVYMRSVQDQIMSCSLARIAAGDSHIVIADGSTMPTGSSFYALTQNGDPDLFHLSCKGNIYFSDNIIWPAMRQLPIFRSVVDSHSRFAIKHAENVGAMMMGCC